MAAAAPRRDLAAVAVHGGEEAPPPGPYKVYRPESPQRCLAFAKYGDDLVYEAANALNPLQKWDVITAQLGSDDTFVLSNTNTGLPITNAQAASLMADPAFFHPDALRNPARFGVDGVAEVGDDGGIPIRIISNGTPMRKRLVIKPWASADNDNHGNAVAEAPAGGGGGDDEAARGLGGPPKRRSKNFLCCFN